MLGEKGAPGSQVKDRIAALEARKTELDATVNLTEESPVLVHPNMSKFYREQVAALRDAPNDEERRIEAASIIRGLVDRIVLNPADGKDGERLSIDLHGALAGILALASGKQKPDPETGSGLEQIKLVAGRGFEPLTFRL